MVSLESITQFFVNNGTLRLSQRKNLGRAGVWALWYEPLLGIAKMGRHLAMAKQTTAKHCITQLSKVRMMPKALR